MCSSRSLLLTLSLKVLEFSFYIFYYHSNSFFTAIVWNEFRVKCAYYKQPMYSSSLLLVLNCIFFLENFCLMDFYLILRCCQVGKNGFWNMHVLIVSLYLCYLQLSGILLDTANLRNPNTTSKDKYMATLLIRGAGGFGFNGLYQICMS